MLLLHGQLSLREYLVQHSTNVVLDRCPVRLVERLLNTVTPWRFIRPSFSHGNVYFLQ
jgi:hypothetical protein